MTKNLTQTEQVITEWGRLETRGRLRIYLVPIDQNFLKIKNNPPLDSVLIIFPADKLTSRSAYKTTVDSGDVRARDTAIATFRLWPRTKQNNANSEVCFFSVQNKTALTRFTFSAQNKRNANSEVGVFSVGVRPQLQTHPPLLDRAAAPASQKCM